MPDNKHLDSKPRRGPGRRHPAKRNGESHQPPPMITDNPGEIPDVADETFDAPTEGGNLLNLKDLKEMKINDLINMSKDFGVENPAGMTRQELIFSILQNQTEKRG
ncbi:MAG: Rho termination factor N-terminal domain-containing protein, partial [Deltaproteobacteria bacterium]|nr:Rho termination factor N-terminal domain-containing protein [Deltaproteobacteria bacterium]